MYAVSSCGEWEAGAIVTTVTKTCSFSARSSGRKGLRTPFWYTASTCIVMAPLYVRRSANVVVDGDVSTWIRPTQQPHPAAPHLHFDWHARQKTFPQLAHADRQDLQRKCTRSSHRNKGCARPKQPSHHGDSRPPSAGFQ